MKEHLTSARASRIFKGLASGSSLLPGPGHFANNNGVEYFSNIHLYILLVAIWRLWKQWIKILWLYCDSLSKGA